MNLFTVEAIKDVKIKLGAGPRFPRPIDDIEVAEPNAICQRRQPLSVVSMVALFREVWRPRVTAKTQDAFLFGLRLMAIDGILEDIAVTITNANYIGRHTVSPGESAFPQLRCVYLCEWGNHAICDVGAWPIRLANKVVICGCCAQSDRVSWQCATVAFTVIRRRYQRLKRVMIFVEAGQSGQDQKALPNDVVKVLDKENDHFSAAVNRCKSASTIISTKPPKATFGFQPNSWRALAVSDKSKSTSDGRR